MSPIKVLNHISPTSLASFSDCRLQWKWGGSDGYKRIERISHFDLGIGVHEALAAYYKGKMTRTMVDPVKVFAAWADAEIAKLGDDVSQDTKTLVEVRTLGIAMLEGYVEEYFGKERLEVLAVEKKVSRPLPETEWSIDVIIDAVVKDWLKHKEVYVLEHKTFTSFNEDYLAKDHQFTAEAWCAELLVPDEKVAGVIWNGLRKHVPGPRTKNPTYERRHLLINENQVEVFHKRARDMYRTIMRGKLAIYPEPNPIRCNMCPFREPCTEYQRGGDYQFILDNSFTKRAD